MDQKRRPLRPTATRPPAVRLIAVGAAVAMALGGCGDGTTAPADPAMGTGEAGSLKATDLLVTTAALPQGWRDSNSQGTDFRLTVCGVDLEPTPPTRATSVRFSKGPVGPFLEQHVRVYESPPEQVVADLAAALPGCTGYEAKGSNEASPTASFVVEPLTVAGAPAGSVSWRQTSRGDVPVTSDLVVMRRGPALVVLMAYGLREAPDPQALAGAVAAVPEVP